VEGKNDVGLRVKRSEVVWNLRKPEVFREIGRMLGVENATEKTPGWFPKRLPAIERILDRMNEGERASLDAEVERINRVGYPDDVKQRYGIFHIMPVGGAKKMPGWPCMSAEWDRCPLASKICNRQPQYITGTWQSAYNDRHMATGSWQPAISSRHMVTGT
jgi:hypothetical protein